MRHSFAKTASEMTLKYHSKITMMLGISVVTNLLLGIGLLTKQEHWVLVPQYNIDRKLEVSPNFSDDYLIDWAAGILGNVLCANPSNIDWKISQLLKISVLSYGGLKEHLRLEAEKMKKDKVSTAFYPKSFKVDHAKASIEVTGEFSAQIGKDSADLVEELRALRS